MHTARRYLIIGGGGGIGSALARTLHAAGARLTLVGRRAEPLAAVAADTAAGVVVGDATDPAAVDAGFAAAIAAHGGVDGVVNLAGSILIKPAHLTRPEEFAEVIAQNLTTAFNVVRAAAKAMTGGGSVVLMGSAAGRTGLANHEAIAAAKAGVIGLAQSAAATYAARGLRVNVVAPGLVRTPMSARITASPQAEQVSAAMHPLGRIGEVADVVPAIAWLLGPDAGWVTGQVIGVDGGLGTVRAR
jgi:NAD(P)-dependent dehydrogenase (short-subunit alcohol dehydrogenase family)